MRKKLNKKADRKFFKKTERRTRAINTGVVPRGGYRL